MKRWLMGGGAVLMATTVATVLVVCTASKGGGNATSGTQFGAQRKDAPAAANGAAAPAGPASGGLSAGSGGHGVLQGAKAPLGDGSAKIRVAQVTVDIRRGGVAAAADRAESIALGVGGEVDGDDRTAGRNATASLQRRVPPESLPTVLTQLAALGHESSRQVSTTDVTEKVADVDSRVTSARQSIARLRTLYANAAKVSDIIAIESELNDREADLESLEAQQRALLQQTSMATITLTLQTVAKAVVPPKPKHHRSGFLGGLERGWDGFVAAARWIAIAVGTLLPFLVLLALLGIAGRFAWRRRPHPAPTPTPSE